MPQPKRRSVRRKGAKGRAVHDVGGLDLGPIDRHEHDLALWEKRVDAMAVLLVGPKKAAFTLDAKRRVIEAYAEREYDATAYYEKWIRAIRNLLIENEIVTREEVEGKLAEVRRAMRASGRKLSNASVPWDKP
jgi:hypothetical protein